jgi:hypothetical protein
MKLHTAMFYLTYEHCIIVGAPEASYIPSAIILLDSRCDQLLVHVNSLISTCPIMQLAATTLRHGPTACRHKQHG